jgi:DNA-binding GntR family transcriptional regulator
VSPKADTRPRSLGDVAYESVRRDILRCVLAPGAHVTESSVCELYRLGKAPVRAALARLSQEGLVRAVPRHGYLIAPITLANVKDMFELRLLVEPMIARLAVGRIDIANLRRVNVAPGASKGEEAEIAFLDSNRDFHLAIAGATGNERILALMAQLLDDMARLLHLGLFSQDWRAGSMRAAHESQAMQHEELIRALDEGDADAAESAARLHIEESRELVMKALHSQHLVTIGRVQWPAPNRPPKLRPRKKRSA